MKRTISSLLALTILLCLLLTGCDINSLLTPAEKPLTDEEYHTLMTPLLTSNPSGDRVVTYLDNQYSRKYIPEQLQAASPEEVGFILQLNVKQLRAMYTEGTVFGEKIQASLVESSSGTVIAETTFQTVFPETLSSRIWKVPVPEEDIMNWVEQQILK